MSDEFGNEVLLHRLYQDARAQRNAYFEKLAFLDGGTVALVVSAVLGPFHGQLKHKYTLGLGLTFLVLAMLILLRRNLQSTVIEFHAASKTASRIPFEPARQTSVEKVRTEVYQSEKMGVLLSGIGMLLLLAEVWLILFGR